MTDPARPFAHLLVPLDGSRLAEAAIPPVRTLAERFGARVTLLHVLEQNAPSSIHGDRHLMAADEAATYLEAIASPLRATRIPVDTHVHDAPEGDVAKSLVNHALEFAPDLIVLCAHGEGGIRGLLFGSMAQQVLQKGSLPVLVVQPPRRGDAPPFAPQRILTPLDGKAEHEGAIGPSIDLAQAFSSEVDLICVVPTLRTLKGEGAATGVLLPSATRAMLDMNEEDASQYLKAVAAPIRARGLTVSAKVLRGDTVQAVVKYAAGVHADLIAMTSHGRTGLDALFEGSVAPRVTAGSEIPILLVRAGDENDRVTQ